MENNQNTALTITTTTKKETKVIDNIIFLYFAEYLGYESPLLKWADKICENKMVPDFILKLIDLDSKMIFNKMKTELTVSEIKDWYDQYYVFILNEYDEKIKKYKNSLLPF